MFLLWPTLLLVFYGLPYYFSTVLRAASVYTVPLRMRGASTFTFKFLQIIYRYKKWSGTWNMFLFLVMWQEFFWIFISFTITQPLIMLFAICSSSYNSCLTPMKRNMLCVPLRECPHATHAQWYGVHTRITVHARVVVHPCARSWLAKQWKNSKVGHKTNSKVRQSKNMKHVLKISETVQDNSKNDWQFYGDVEYVKDISRNFEQENFETFHNFYGDCWKILGTFWQLRGED